ncbi:MAG TPA: NADPH:quinone oxidoreductase family protein [Polyangiaceae bacterium]|jgi:NADPH2:quinone reductase|nr:NADPH:quinone oxidoreductase family protein [Polyangiaceae bacterium]
MRAVVVDRFMKPSELTVSEAPEPVLGDDQVLIDVHAAGCNFFDTLIVQGKYQEKPAFPFSPGGELAGVVRAVGARVEGTKVGERVMAHVGHGGFAERAVASPAALHPIPDGMSFEAAAAFPIVYGTAYVSVVQRGAVRPGETVLVTAAAGGVGLAAVQIARAVGARVVALASGDKLDVAREAGADVALDYRAENFVEKVREATSGRGVDVVIENVGGDVFDGCTRCIAWGGRLVVVGFASGRIPEIAVNRVMLKHISVVGVHFGPMYREELHSVRSAFAALDSLFRQGKVTPLVSASMQLERVAEALDALGNRKTVGKIVLTP